MRLELLRPWRQYRAGSILPAVPEGQARVMIRRGLGRESEPEAAKLRLKPVARKGA